MATEFYPKHLAQEEFLKLTDKENQTERILKLLGDGGWHTGLEFTRLQQPILSYTRRITELRRAGHVIRKERRDGLWKYCLVSGDAT